MTLDERKQRILGAVVRDYVQTVRPVGSEDLAARHAWGVKSATIRGEMAELSEMGYLCQPHTSAGRIPSDRGYRFYVDHLMTVRPVRRVPSPSPDAELTRLLRQTCALLTRQTSYTAVATPPRPADTMVTQVLVSPVADGRLLLVLLLSTGQMQNRLLPEAEGLSLSDLAALGASLSAALSGRTLDELSVEGTSLPAAPGEFSAPLRTWFDALLSASRLLARHAAQDDGAIVEGASEILRQPEFRDAEKLGRRAGNPANAHSAPANAVPRPFRPGRCGGDWEREPCCGPARVLCCDRFVFCGDAGARHDWGCRPHAHGL